MPEVGEQAPEFNALDQNRERFILSKAVQKGKVLLVFYPGDDTPVCTAQLCDYRDHNEDFKKLGVQIYGISISSNESQHKFYEKNKFSFPLLADYDTRITTKYGVMSFTGHPKRALFLIGEDQKILFKHVEPLAILHRNSEDLLEKIRAVLPPPAAPTAPAESTESSSPPAS